VTRKPTSARTARDESARQVAPASNAHVNALLLADDRLRRALGRQFRTLWRTRKLSERGSFIMGLVNAGVDRPSRLIEHFDVLPSTITFETDKLVAAGLLRRESDPSDRRVVRLSLTDEGRAVHHETVRTVNAFLQPVLATLSPNELDQFLATFRKIVDQLPIEP
jgi:DNA-binding MarR family transcriptional regulator